MIPSVKTIADNFFNQIKEEIQTDVRRRIQLLVERTVEENKTRIINDVLKEARVKANVELVEVADMAGYQVKVSITPDNMSSHQ